MYFDLVMALDVVEHIEDYFTFLRKFRTKGKYKLIQVPLGLFLLKILCANGFAKERKAHGHIHYFTKEIFFSILEDVGYKVIDWEYLPKRLEVPNTGKLAKGLKIPRKILAGLSTNLSAKILGGFSLSVLAV